MTAENKWIWKLKQKQKKILDLYLKNLDIVANLINPVPDINYIPSIQKKLDSNWPICLRIFPAAYSRNADWTQRLHFSKTI